MGDPSQSMLNIFRILLNQGYLHLDFKGGSVNLFIGGKLPQMDGIEIMMIHGWSKPINAQSISNTTLIKVSAFEFQRWISLMNLFIGVLLPQMNRIEILVSSCYPRDKGRLAILIGWKIRCVPATFFSSVNSVVACTTAG